MRTLALLFFWCDLYWICIISENTNFPLSRSLALAFHTHCTLDMLRSVYRSMFHHQTSDSNRIEWKTKGYSNTFNGLVFTHKLPFEFESTNCNQPQHKRIARAKSVVVKCVFFVCSNLTKKNTQRPESRKILYIHKQKPPENMLDDATTIHKTRRPEAKSAIHKVPDKTSSENRINLRLGRDRERGEKTSGSLFARL